MIRASSLPDAEMCGWVKEVAKLRPRTYRNTLLGSAFHAHSATQADEKEKMERLTPDERADVLSWCKPIDFKDGPVVLRYAEARKEMTVGLGRSGMPMEVRRDEAGNYIDDPDLLVPATVDMAWFRDDHPSGGTVYVADIKTGIHSVDPMSLQFVAPAFALAEQYGADWIRTGIWWARRGEWEWAEPVAVDSPMAVQLWERIKMAESNPPIPVVGSHCGECFNRSQCEAHMLPITQLGTELAPLVEPGGLSAENILKAHLTLQALSKIVDMGKDTLKAWVKENGPVKLPKGGTIQIDHRAGREYADVNLIKEDGLMKYIKRSKPSEVVAVKK